MTTSGKKGMGDGTEEEGGEQHPTLEVESIEILLDDFGSSGLGERTEDSFLTTIDALVEKGGTRLE